MTFTIRVISYGPERVEEKTLAAASEIREWLAKKNPVTWVDIEGEVDAGSLAEVGEIFKLHDLALEDVVHANQRSKVEQYGDSHFLVTRMISLDEVLGSEQLSIFFGKDFVVTFQNKPGGDCLNSVRDRLRKGAGKIRQESPAHLAYALIDACVDAYFPVLEEIGERLNKLEEQILTKYDSKMRARIHEVKHDVITIRRMIWPLRDAVNSLIRDADDQVSHETLWHLRDCYDHVSRLMDYVETYQTVCSDLQNLQQGSEASQTNEILKVLAVMSTLIMAPTLIGSIYGMNFNPDKSPYNMPELNWLYGYPMALGLMILLAGGLLGWLYWKGWLNRQKPLDLTSRRARWDRAVQRNIARLRASNEGEHRK